MLEWIEENGAISMLLESLRENTRSYHEAIEQSRLLSSLLGPNLSRENYVQVLKVFYGFYKPLEENLVQNCKRTWLKTVIENRLKTRLILIDLAMLGQGEVSSLPLCTQLPCSDRISTCLGILYVCEGSTLGGRVIAKSLHAATGITAKSGGAFFHGYGPRTASMWKDTCRILNGVAQDNQIALPEIVMSAVETFDALNKWLTKNE